MTAEEEVTSPDQRTPDNLKLWRAGWVLCALLVLVMVLGNHQGDTEDLWLVGIAAIIIIGLIADGIMRKKGIKR